MPHQPDRRAWLGATAAGTVATSAMAGGAPTASSAIAAENRKPGTLDWQLTYARFDSGAKYRSSLIEGYATKTSVRPGQSVGFCLSVQKPGPVHIDIYRMGHYQGLGGRHMARLGPFEAKPQATPPVADMRLRQCRWTPATEFTVPADWPSGVYLGKLSAGHHRYQSYIVFIVTSDKPADILFQCSTNTWQAYNKWPETHSLYDNDRPDKKPLVSGVRATFDRPYAKYPQVVDHPLSLGSGEFLLWETATTPRPASSSASVATAASGPARRGTWPTSRWRRPPRPPSSAPRPSHPSTVRETGSSPTPGTGCSKARE